MRNKEFNKYFEKIQDWVVDNCCPPNDKNPNHEQFSAAEVASIICQYNNAKLNGQIK